MDTALDIVTYIHFLFRVTNGSSAIFVSDGSFLKSCVLRNLKKKLLLCLYIYTSMALQLSNIRG